MREIKFRAWDIKNKRMIYEIEKAYDGCYQDNDGNDVEQCFWIFILKENYIVEQFTGLFDKHGVEIYEGDRVIVDNDVKGSLFYSLQLGGYEIWIVGVGENGTYHCPLNVLDSTNIEVIGNIHDKELEE